MVTHKDGTLQDRISALIKEVPESFLVLEYIIVIGFFFKKNLSNNVYTQKSLSRNHFDQVIAFVANQ